MEPVDEVTIDFQFDQFSLFQAKQLNICCIYFEPGISFLSLYMSMGENNTVVSACTMYGHLQQYCSHPSIFISPKTMLVGLII